VLSGAAGLDQFTLEQVRSPNIHQMMSKVTLVKDFRLEETFPREWPARVVIALANGQKYEKLVRYPKGDPENPLTWEEMSIKFRSLAGRVLSAERCNHIIEQIATLNPAALVALCC
jgi:2-methylcitrate dehydratase PrpD